ncbi:hypothetical protein [Streptomyces sp. NPDC012825]|uniref:hypothetical protein n=1 Tax=Streptomyces sp. NPDC012825 TaxID=3364851 RepID=UPI00367A0B5C
MIHKKSVQGTVLAAAVLAALAVSCGTTPEPDRPASGAGAAGPDRAGATPYPDNAYAPSTGEKVRDAFATLQATLNDSCAKDCDYFLGRVNKELQELDRAMKNDPKGPGHFPEPIQKMTELNNTLGADASSENLKKHHKQLIATRDFINTWMQDHPDDYR